MNSFSGGFIPMSYKDLFEPIPSLRNVQIEDYKPEIPAKPIIKRTNRSVSIRAKKRARMTRGDELVTDEKAKKVATEMLDQIQNSPGRITLDFSSPETANLVPIPPEFSEISHESTWKIDNLAEGQLSTLLAQSPRSFKSLRLSKIKKGKVEHKILPRDQPLKESLESLKTAGNSNDDFIGFSVAVANVLRKCDAAKAKSLTQTISSIIAEKLQ